MSPRPFRAAFAAALALSSSAMASPALAAPASPSGANDWSCRPGADHPRPVVLVHATLTDMATNWMKISPLLKADGYCVFAFNYGATNPALPSVGGLGETEESGRTMSEFIERVREETGSRKVDLVGHSQGGMLLKYYISGLGGGSKVGTAVALAPTIHGTTLSGLTSLAPLLPGFTEGFARANPGAWNQSVGSAFMKQLNTLPDTSGGAKLTVISTRYDMVVTPYASQRPTGPGTKWIVLQNQCALDFVDHVGVALDSIAHRLMLNELDPDTARRITCKFIAPVLGG